MAATTVLVAALQPFRVLTSVAVPLLALAVRYVPARDECGSHAARATAIPMRTWGVVLRPAEQSCVDTCADLLTDGGELGCALVARWARRA